MPEEIPTLGGVNDPLDIETVKAKREEDFKKVLSEAEKNQAEAEKGPRFIRDKYKNEEKESETAVAE